MNIRLFAITGVLALLPLTTFADGGCTPESGVTNPCDCMRVTIENHSSQYAITLDYYNTHGGNGELQGFTNGTVLQPNSSKTFYATDHHGNTPGGTIYLTDNVPNKPGTNGDVHYGATADTSKNICKPHLDPVRNETPSGYKLELGRTTALNSQAQAKFEFEPK